MAEMGVGGGDIAGNPGYQTLYNQGVQNRNWDPNAQGFMQDVLSRYGTQFAGAFKNSTGQDPTSDDYSKFFSNIGEQVQHSPAGYGGTSYSDIQNLITPYIQNQYGQQVQQNQQQQQTNNLQQNQKTIQGLIDQSTAANTKAFTDPNSDTFKSFSGNLNNLGITPSSGAFQAGLGSALGQGAVQAENQALSQFDIPSVGAIQQTAGAPYQNDLANMYPGLQQYGQQQSNLYDFNLQSDLAKQLASSGSPSGFQTGFGQAVSGLGAAGNAAQGGAAAYQATSYVCMELIKRGLCSEYHLDLLHYNSFPAMFKKARAFWGYAMNGKKIVDACNKAGIDWSLFKEKLINIPLHERDAVKVVEKYTEACKELCMIGDPSLWDERYLRTSLVDSLPFIPLLFTYKPFLKVMIKVLRMKCLFLIDLPCPEEI